MKKLLAASTALLAAPLLSASVLLDEDFSYSDGPLAGQGTWARGPSSPASDNPSNHIVVSDGAVLFDWTTAAAINNLVRHIWPADEAVEGTIFAAFDLVVTTAPLSAPEVRPGFFSFGDGAGNQQRGFVGIQAGSVPGTFNLGISNNSQLGGNFTFDTEDLSPGTVYRVMVSFNSFTTATRLWIDTTNPQDAPRVAISAATTSNSLRRVNLRMFNSDGDGGTTNLGVFTLDNLVVTAGEPEEPPPPTVLPYEDAFAYMDGPLSGQGSWQRGTADPTPDNPSDHIVVENEQVKFDWTITEPLNHAVRLQWEDEEMTSGMIYAAFDLRVTQVPQPAVEAAPGFISFDRSGGGQLRGHVGIRAGDQPGTFQLGISPSSQFAINFTFAPQNLSPNTTYRVMVGYDAATSETRLWIGGDNPAAVPAATAIGNPSVGVRRIQLRMYNTDGGEGTTNLGVFYLDNLFVGTMETVLVPVLHIARVAEGLRVEWDQAPGQSTSLEYNSALEGGWMPLDTFETNAEAERIQFTDTTWDGITPRFYRLDVQ